MKVSPCILLFFIITGVFLSGCITGDTNDQNQSERVADAEGMARKSLENVNATLQKDQSNTTAWVTKGTIHQRLKEYDEANYAYDRALDLEPNLTRVWLYKGNIQHIQGNLSEALRMYETGIALDPNQSLLWAYRAEPLPPSPAMMKLSPHTTMLWFSILQMP